MSVDVAALVEQFCSLQRSQLEHDQALARIEGGLVERALTIADVVKELGPFLTHAQNLLRARGTLLLTSLLEKLSPSAGYVDAQQQKFLLAFLIDRAKDTPCVAEVMRGMLAMLVHWPLIDNEVERIVTCIFTEVHAQSCDQPTRHTILSVMESILSKHLRVAQQLDHDFAFGYLQIVDGERDPRNLLLIFNVLTPAVVAHIPGHARFVEDIFDVTSCYYPINFTPRQNDSITAEMLMSSLDKAMCCSASFGALCLPFLLEKLEAKSSAVGWASFVHAVGKFALADFSKHVAKNCWDLLCKDAYGAEAQPLETAVLTVQQLLRVLSENYVSSSVVSAQQPLDLFLGFLVAAVRGHFGAGGSPDTKVHAISLRLVCSAAAASIEASRILAGSIVPLLLSLIAPQEQDEQQSKRTLEALVAIVAALHPSTLQGHGEP
jgi:DNA repair/transcription protein MET18/MMS19